MGFKFGKCKQLKSIWSQAFENTDPDFIDFEGCDSLIRIGDQKEFGQLSSISYESFCGCNNLKNISLKNCHNLQCIGKLSFAPSQNVAGSLESVDFTGCDGLKVFGTHVFTPYDANFYHHPNLISIDISPCINLESIDSYFMDHITGLKEFHMENLTHLTRIGSYCASWCPELEAIYASGCSAVESIAAFAQSDTKLTHADLTGWDSLKTLDTYAFHQCSILETIIGWTDLKTHLETIGSSAFQSDKQLKIDISNMPALKIIKNNAFNGDISMKTCPNNCPSLETIEGYAFNGCTNLGLNDDGTHATLDLSNNTNLTTIGNSAFEGVKAIETINLDNDTSLATLGNKCFYGNTELKHFYARNCTSLTSIGSDMLNGSTQLLDARFGGSGVQIYGTRALKNLPNLLYVEFPEDTVKTIGYECMHTSGLQTIKSSVSNYDEWKAAITQAQINAGLISDGDDYLSTHLKSNVLQQIDGFGFFKCSIIEYVDGDNSPYNCNHGETQEFNQSLIHDLSFQNCTTLTKFSSMYASGAKILETINCTNSPVVRFCDSSFRECYQLQNVECDKTIINQIDDYAFYMTTRADAIAYDWDCQPLITIGKGAFHRSTLIKSITTDSGSATNVGDGFAAFAPNLETVSITNMSAMTSIGNEAFIQCPKLQSADFSGCNALTTIGSKAFQIDAQMTTFKIQDSPLEKIDQYAFMSCLRLENFDADSSKIKTIGIQAFEYCTSFKTFKIHQDDTQQVTYERSAFAGWRNAASGLTPPTYPLDIYIYGSTPGDVAGDTQWGFVNGMNNNGCQVTIHFNTNAEDSYKAIAKHKEDVAHARTSTDVQTGKDVVWYWCCSNGQATATTGGTTPVEGNFQCAGWYATSIATTPVVVFDL